MDQTEFGRELLNVVFAGKIVRLYDGGYVRICMTFPGKTVMNSTPFERLLAVSHSGDVTKKSGLGRTVAAGLTLGANLLTPSNRGDLFISLVTEANTHLLHTSRPTKEDLGSINQIVAVANLILESNRSQTTDQQGFPSEVNPNGIQEGSSLASELKNLAELKMKGLLSDAEFETVKARLLGDEILPIADIPPSAPAESDVGQLPAPSEVRVYGVSVSGSVQSPNVVCPTCEVSDHLLTIADLLSGQKESSATGNAQENVQGVSGLLASSRWAEFEESIIGAIPHFIYGKQYESGLARFQKMRVCGNCLVIFEAGVVLSPDLAVSKAWGGKVIYEALLSRGLGEGVTLANFQLQLPAHHGLEDLGVTNEILRALRDDLSVPLDGSQNLYKKNISDDEAYKVDLLTSTQLPEASVVVGQLQKGSQLRIQVAGSHFRSGGMLGRRRVSLQELTEGVVKDRLKQWSRKGNLG